MSYEYDEEYLEHHGVLGMKWGIRRYQNADGSYTAAGRKRYGLDLDLKDKSRTNVAKIRRGEALRRLDVAKNNNSTNSVRIAELQGRARTAKRIARQAKKVEKGAQLAAKGQTIRGNKWKMIGSNVATNVGRWALTSGLSEYKNEMVRQGKWNQSKHSCAAAISKYGQYALISAHAAYLIKKGRDNANLRAYEKARSRGEISTKQVGSDEYRARIERASKKKG